MKRRDFFQTLGGATLGAALVKIVPEGFLDQPMVLKEELNKKDSTHKTVPLHTRFTIVQYGSKKRIYQGIPEELIASSEQEFMDVTSLDFPKDLRQVYPGRRNTTLHVVIKEGRYSSKIIQLYEQGELCSFAIKEKHFVVTGKGHITNVSLYISNVSLNNECSFDISISGPVLYHEKNDIVWEEI